MYHPSSPGLPFPPLSGPNAKVLTIRRWFCIVSHAVVAVALGAGCRGPTPSAGVTTVDSIAAAAPAPAAGLVVRRTIGFRSARHLGDHYRKHGSEFEGYTEADYLGAAQELRDRPAGGEILELDRGDGTVSRFDRKSGAFLAFDQDGTIRTFFKPNDGEAYFRRQARRSHQ